MAKEVTGWKIEVEYEQLYNLSAITLFHGPMEDLREQWEREYELGSRWIKTLWQGGHLQGDRLGGRFTKCRAE